MSAPFRIESFDSEPEWLALRETGIGASEVYDVISDPAKIYCLKRRLIEPFAGNDNTEWGNRLEPVIAAKAAEVFGITLVKPDAVCVSLSHPHCLCSLDGVEANEWAAGNISTVYEFKSSGLVGDWGETDSDEYPERYYIQTQAQMGVTGAKRAVLCVLLMGRNREFRHYVIERDEAVIDRLMTVCEGLWTNHIEPGIPPTPDPKTCTLDVVRAITGYSAGKSVVLAENMAETVLKWHQAKEFEAEAKNLRKRLQATIELQMGDAAVATIEGIDGIELNRRKTQCAGHVVKPHERVELAIPQKCKPTLLGLKATKEIA